MSMSFEMKMKHVVLEVLPCKQAWWFLQIVAVDRNKEMGSHQQAMKTMIEEFKQAFVELVGLPPMRSFHHMILLKECIAHVSVRPYIYPHF